MEMAVKDYYSISETTIMSASLKIIYFNQCCQQVLKYQDYPDLFIYKNIINEYNLF